MSDTAGALLLVALSHDPLVVVALAVAPTVPWLLFTIPAGLVVDRVDRRKLLVTAQLLRFVGTAPLAWAVLSGHPHPAVVAGVAFLVSSVETVVDGAADAALPDLVPPGELVRA